jgi:hypothetical protein
MSAGVAANATGEERRASLKAAYLARLADVRACQYARLAAMKQHLPSLAARLQNLCQDLGGARRPVPSKMHLRATATLEKRLGKAEVLLRLTEDCLVSHRGVPDAGRGAPEVSERAPGGH